MVAGGHTRGPTLRQGVCLAATVKQTQFAKKLFRALQRRRGFTLGREAIAKPEPCPPQIFVIAAVKTAFREVGVFHLAVF